MLESKLIGWPKMADTVTRTQMLAFARERDEALAKEDNDAREFYPEALEAWEMSIVKLLHDRIPRIVNFLRANPDLHVYGLGFDHDEGLASLFKDLVPPPAPSESRRWTEQYRPAIAYLESLTTEDLSAEQRLILQRLGCSAD